MPKKIILIGMVFLMVQFLDRSQVQGADSKGKVALMPFTVHSPTNLSYLQKNILEALSDGLHKQNIPVLPLDKTQLWLTQKVPTDWRELRTIGKQLEVDFLVFGSLTKIGQRMNLTGNLLDLKTENPPLTFSLTEEGLENILRLMERFSKEVGSRILSQEKIIGISIKGNQRIETQTIEKELKSKPGEPYIPEFLDQDLRAIFKMGFFSDVRLEVEENPRGKLITFVVEERPFVKRVDFSGNKEIKEDDLKEQVTIKPYTILNLNTVSETQEKLTAFYQSKGYYNIRMTYSVTYEDQGKAAVVVFNIVEGKKVYIKTITFQGNKGFSGKQLKSIMNTNEKGYFSWFTSSGVYKKELLELDLEKLSSFYYNHGYLKAKVGEPTVVHEGDWLFVTISIDEGRPYTMGQVTIRGDLIQPLDKMMAALAITKEKFYNREVIRKDILMMNDLYSYEGYAFVEISPQIQEDPAALKVDLVYEIKKGPKVYFERIDIVGNVKTRDKVIRREFGVAEQGLFDAKALRKSNQNLHRLDFFEEINLSTSPGTQEDRMKLKVEVKEKMTGAFSLGAGYSAVENFMVMGQISERNLFGRGQRLSLDAQLGGVTTRYNLGFFEPWLFDTRISSDINIYNWTRIFDEYTKDSIGGSLGFGYPILGEDIRAFITYAYDDANVTEVEEGAAQIIQDMEGRHQTSSVRLALRRDTRDLIFNTTKGSVNSVSVEYAGGPLGGTNYFTRYLASSGWFFPLFWRTTFFAHGKWGYITQNAGGDLPLYEKFYLGGINTVRGFIYNEISPKDPATGQSIGGEQMVQFNFEFIFPLIEKSGLKGVIFFDAGDVYTKDQSIDLGSLRKSVGAGIRWYSPLGPLRLEWGWNFDPRPGERGNNWEFSIGTFF
ncbi:MAG: outer membrane protein assembly factor BamA [Deltaproteobacteria bacterium]|nr:outer membrane protein assembly factor BamA [Deltaproteobacteria bacterium]